MICLFCGAEPLAYSLYHAGGLCVPSANRTAVETQLFDEMLRDLQRYNDYRRNADAVFAPVDGFDPLPALTTATDALKKVRLTVFGPTTLADAQYIARNALGETR